VADAAGGALLPSRFSTQLGPSSGNPVSAGPIFFLFCRRDTLSPSPFLAAVWRSSFVPSSLPPQGSPYGLFSRASFGAGLLSSQSSPGSIFLSWAGPPWSHEARSDSPLLAFTGGFDFSLDPLGFCPDRPRPGTGALWRLALIGGSEEQFISCSGP